MTGFEGAMKYVNSSIQQCSQLSDFLRKRHAIEEEYAKSMSIIHILKLLLLFRETV